MNSNNSIQKAVMRRVYYSYAISVVTHSFFWQGVFLGFSVVLLAKWLHVASIVHNFLSVPVGSAPRYLYNSFLGAITHGEFLTALTLVLSGLVAISCGYKMAQIFFSHHSRVLTFNS